MSAPAPKPSLGEEAAKQLVSLGQVALMSWAAMLVIGVLHGRHDVVPPLAFLDVWFGVLVLRCLRVAVRFDGEST